ncbi:MBL fold metallo-hydrolase [Streptomyces sp. MST-110588]|uniref:MBL fold metallo-hydrolase n=1 Tax=Streptomyces sp. MST-110588 TaxID=2833628 RepID=UPI001F5C197C|nr:MBL fold metallo-hydrolase [Streptomyces sp. MST-110588]UNO42341.1 MBL fold metallo-hydrolase [Streptomyces sp. MST-110588]
MAQVTGQPADEVTGQPADEVTGEPVDEVTDTATGQVTDHRGGVWSIAVPIPDNPLGHTLVHLLETDRGPVLVDTGWDDPRSWDTLTAGIGACGFDATDIHGVVITHHHPDHHGLSGRVRETSGAWIAMHAADAAVVRRTREAGPGRWLDHLTARLAAAGAPESHLAPLRQARAEGRGRSLPGLRAALPDREIVPGELLDLPGRRLRAVWTPGHTPGHVCLHLEEGGGVTRGGRLFSGDHLLPGISPHIGLYEDPDGLYEHPDGDDGGDPESEVPGADPLGDYLDSLERVARLAPAEVLPAHQHPFTDTAGRVRELIAHHAERLSGLRALLSVPLTPWQLAEKMKWNRPWDRIPHASRTIAVSEAQAHLRHLVKRGLAEPVPGSADPVTYQAV